MGKETGLGAGFFLDGIDLSGDTRELSTISKAIQVIEQTGIDKFAVERNSGQLTGEVSWTSYFNPTNAHLKLEDLPRTDVGAMYMHKQAVLGTPCACMVAKQTNYDPTRGNTGELTLGVQCLSNAYWLDWGKSVTQGKRSDTTATNGTGVDFDAAGTFGLQAYLHVFSFTGTSITLTLQSATTLGGAYSAITGGAFAAASAVGSQRIETARNGTQNQFIRVVSSGTFSQCTFAVAVAVNRTDMTI